MEIEREGEREKRMKWDHKDRVRLRKAGEKSDRYLGYCFTQQYCWKEGCVLNMTATGHNKDT